MAVAYGGTLHPEIRDLPERDNHRMLQDVPRENRYDIRHAVHLTHNGVFANLYGAETIHVNSLHGQGVIEPGKRVGVEGRAEDSTIEAVSIADAAGFALGVQWHAEHAPWDQKVNAVLWDDFASRL